MLTEKRQEEILRLLTLKGSVTVQELKEYFDASESTIRRDLNTLDEKGALVKSIWRSHADRIKSCDQR